MAKGKTSAYAHATNQENRPNKTEAMRQALQALGYDAKPAQLKDHIKAKFGIDMSTTLISSYKTTLSKKAAGQSAITPKPTARVTAATTTKSGISLEDIKTVKELADRIGADQLKALAEVLAR